MKKKKEKSTQLYFQFDNHIDIFALDHVITTISSNSPHQKKTDEQTNDM